MTSRLINADAIEYSPLDDIYNNDVMVAYKESIENMPTVDAEPVRHGCWKPARVVDDCFWMCSSCGFPSEASGANILYKYCPHCGAKMDAKRKEE